MPRAKGTPKTGGRQKGTPNKKTQRLIDRAEALGVDPFEVLLRFCKRDWKGLGYESSTRPFVTKSGEVIDIDVITPELQLAAAKEACQYLHPKRKAIELTDADGRALTVVALVEGLSGSGGRGSGQS